MEKKLLYFLLAISIVFSLFSSSFASDSKNELEIVKSASETKKIENGTGYISKSIVDSNSETGEVTIELKLSNTAQETENASETEIFLIIDNSPSMDFLAPDGQSRKNKILDSAYKLTQEVFKLTSNVKIGLVDFDGLTATIYSGHVRQELTNNEETIFKAISDCKARSTTSGTNIDAGMKRAIDSFSKTDNNKVIILLTDGVPTHDTKGITSGNVEEEISDKTRTVCENTKQTILEAKNSGIYTITMLTGMDMKDTEENGNPAFSSEKELKANLEAAELVFGTSQAPTANKYYLVESTNIENVITTDILKDVSTQIGKSLKNVKIVDYFPQDIVENFEFEYVGNPTNGTISPEIDSENYTIEWNVGDVPGGQVVTVRYKLKLKDMENEKIFDREIATNEKVVLDYNDEDGGKHEIELTSSPVIKLTKKTTQSQESTGSNSTKDPTVSSEPLPKTGLGVTILVILLGILFSVLVIIFFYKSKDYK